MTHVAVARMLSALMLVPAFAFGAPALIPPSVEVGRNLQTSISIRLSERSPEQGLRVTVKSDDPKRLRVAKTPEAPGEAALTLELRGGVVLTPEFWIQAVGEPGRATYSASADGYGTAKGTVTVTPSGLVIIGPFKAPSFSTTPRSPAAKFTVYTVRLDSSLKLAEEQHTAVPLSLKVRNSDATVGTVTPDRLAIPIGASHASAEFKPAKLGKATLTVDQPPGFSVPATFASLTAMVERPGMAIAQDMILGKDLEEEGLLCLGEPAPPGGLEVKLISSDPSKLVISSDPHRLGAGSVVLKVPSGELTAKYVLQALADSGKVAYRAEAEGYRSSVAAVTLTKAGVIVAYAPYGPPDEAAVLRKSDLEDNRQFFVSLAESRRSPPKLAVFTGFLHPLTGRIADVTVQRLRAGVSVTVDLTTSNPVVATVQPQVTIPSGHSNALVDFKPESIGDALISVSIPPGFGKPENATTVPVTVRE